MDPENLSRLNEEKRRQKDCRKWQGLELLRGIEPRTFRLQGV
jgi:hypothetical protein